jgi:hypothetical protein
MTTIDTLKRAIEYKAWVGAKNMLGSRGDPSKCTRIKCHIALSNLPYFQITVLILLLIECFRNPKISNFLQFVVVNSVGSYNKVHSRWLVMHCNTC